MQSAITHLFAGVPVSDLDARIEWGDFTPLDAWLRDNVWGLGSRYDTNELVRRATGQAPGAAEA